MNTISPTRPKSPLVILRRAYLDIVSSVDVAQKQVTFCAAKLIDYFRHWEEWKTKHQRSEWIYLPLKWIHQDLMGEHSLHTIRAAIALLEELKLISRRHNPANGQDKTWQYRLHLDYLEQLLDTNELGTFRSESSKNNGESQQQNLTTNFKSTATGVGFDLEEEKVSLAETRQAINEALTEERLELKSCTDSGETLVEGNSTTEIGPFLERLRNLGVPLSEEVKDLIKRTPHQKLAQSIAALEEVAQVQPLRSPIGALKHFIKNNLSPRDPRRAWTARAMAAWGKERFEQLVIAVTEYAGAIRILLTNGKQISLSEAQQMSWEAIAQIGGASHE